MRRSCLLSPSRTAARMSSRYLRMVRASLTNGRSLDREAQPSQASRCSVSPCPRAERRPSRAAWPCWVSVSGEVSLSRPAGLIPQTLSSGSPEPLVELGHDAGEMRELGHVMHSHFVGKLFHLGLTESGLRHRRGCPVPSRKVLELGEPPNPEAAEELHSALRFTRQVHDQRRGHIGCRGERVGVRARARPHLPAGAGHPPTRGGDLRAGAAGLRQGPRGRARGSPSATRSGMGRSGLRRWRRSPR